MEILIRHPMGYSVNIAYIIIIRKIGQNNIIFTTKLQFKRNTVMTYFWVSSFMNKDNNVYRILQFLK